MKTSIFIKTFIVIIALSLLGYIIYQNNQATEITELVTKPIDRYDFSLYTDSVCEKIRLSNHSFAKQQYDSLYEKIDVYSKIATSTGETFINDSLSQLLYKEAMQAYWPIFQNRANMTFQGDTWGKSLRKDIKSEIEQLEKCQGLNQRQKDSLKNYSNYLKGYINFSNLLGKLEKCVDSTTYVKHNHLSYYAKYPYSNLTKLQERKEHAKSKAKAYWKSNLMKQKDDIERHGNSLMSNNIISKDDIILYRNCQEDWLKKVASYERTINDDSAFKFQKAALESLYRNLTKKHSEQTITTTQNY